MVRFLYPIVVVLSLSHLHSPQSTFVADTLLAAFTVDRQLVLLVCWASEEVEVVTTVVIDHFKVSYLSLSFLAVLEEF